MSLISPISFFQPLVMRCCISSKTAGRCLFPDFVNLSLKRSFQCPQACFWAVLSLLCMNTYRRETCIDMCTILHNTQTHRSAAVSAWAHKMLLTYSEQISAQIFVSYWKLGRNSGINDSVFSLSPLTAVLFMCADTNWHGVSPPKQPVLEKVG